jgi:hypothetical protein
MSFSTVFHELGAHRAGSATAWLAGPGKGRTRSAIVSPTALQWRWPSPTGRRPVGGALAPVTDHGPGIWGRTRSGVCGSRIACQGLAGKEGDHVWEKRCSGLDLLGCDPGPGYAARVFNLRETELAYGSLRLRDGVRATSSSSRWVCRISGAPPLFAPARVIPGRTLL